MVFEGILVDLLNRFLGSYVKNLDASQLKVGIFGGENGIKCINKCQLACIILFYNLTLETIDTPTNNHLWTSLLHVQVMYS